MNNMSQKIKQLPTGLMVNVVDKRVLIPTDNPDIFNHLPYTNRTYVEQWQRWVVGVPLNEDVNKYLRNCGVPTKGAEPFRYFYDPPLLNGKYPPMEHQIETASFLVEEKRAYCLSTMRTGKTYACVLAVDYLQTVKHKRAALIVATVTNMTDVWMREISTTLPHKKVSVIHGSPEQRKKAIEVEADYYLINYDGMKTMGKTLLTMIKKKQIEICVVDEVTHYSNPQSGRYKAMEKTINDKDSPVEYVWGLTGSPGNDPEPIYGQVRLITPYNMKEKWYTWRRKTMVNLYAHKWVPAANANEHIKNAMKPTIRFNKDDIFDLPPVTRAYYHSPLTQEQERLLHEYGKDMVAIIKDDTQTIESAAVSKSAAVNKMLQVCTGAVRMDDKVHRINIDQRLNDLHRIIGSTDRKVVIFCAFRETIEIVAEFCRKRNIGYSLSHGGVTGNKRANEILKFQEDDDVKVIIAHPQTTAYGTELSAADTMIFFGPPRSGYTAFVQAVERMSSLKQTAESTRIIYFYGSKEERLAFASIEKGESEGVLINALFEEITNG